MTTTQEEISEWFDTGVANHYDRMIVVCDTYDWSDYPVFVNDDEFWDKYNHYNGNNMQRIMEVYDLHKDRDSQLNDHRAFNIPKRQDEK